MRNAVFILLASVVLSGCASKLYVPGNRFLTPETSGDLFSGDVKVGGAGVTHVQIADDITSSSPDTTPVLLKNSSALVGAQIGLASWIDGYVNTVIGAPTFAGAKIQLIGSPARSAKSGNFSLAIAGGGAFGSSDTSASVNGTEGKANVKFGGWEGMVLIGFRPSDGILLYLSPSMMQVTGTAKIERTSGGTTTTTAEPNGRGEMRSAAAGLRLGQALFLNVEVAATETTWKRTNPTELESKKFTDTALGVALGGSW